MPTTLTPISGAIAGTEVVDVDSDATSEADVRSGATRCYYVDIDNSSNSSVNYFKAYNAAAPTIGTTAPDLVIRAPANRRTQVWIANGRGFNFATALSFATVTAAGTAGTTSPTSDVVVRIGTT